MASIARTDDRYVTQAAGDAVSSRWEGWGMDGYVAEMEATIAGLREELDLVSEQRDMIAEITDDMVERAARALFDDTYPNGHSQADAEMAFAREDARIVLTAALHWERAPGCSPEPEPTEPNMKQEMSQRPGVELSGPK